MEQPSTVINNTSNTGDHDLLLTLKATMETKLDRVISDVKDLNDNFAGRVNSLESEKLNNTEFEEYKRITTATVVDQENRIRALEIAKWLLWGAIAIIGFIITTLSNTWANIHF